MDLAFVLDSSGSIGRRNWLKILHFAKNIVLKISIGETKTRVGVASYGNEGTVHIRLKDYYHVTGLTDAIDDVRWKDQWTNTASGLYVTRTKLFNSTNGNRGHIPDVIILLIDGVSNKNKSDTIPQATLLRDAGVEIFVLGIGGDVDPRELEGIAGDKLNVMRIKNFDKLLLDATAYDVLDTMWGKCIQVTSNIDMCICHYVYPSIPPYYNHCTRNNIPPPTPY